MKYIVKVGDQDYEVEIEDLFTRPIIARVEGQEFEVSLEEEVRPKLPNEPHPVAATEPQKLPTSPATGNAELYAPLPGTVIEVFVRDGDHVEAGQVLLVIEAMKMKNSIRSTRTGEITELLVSAGQTVAHKQTLVRFG